MSVPTAQVDAFTPVSAFQSGDIMYAKRTGPLDVSMDILAAVDAEIDAHSAGNRLSFKNVTIAASVAANALTIAMKQKDNTTDPANTATGKGVLAFRSSTLTSGAFVTRNITAALSLVIPSGATMGFTNAVADNIYVYAIDNAGTVELAVSTEDLWDEGLLWSTTVLDTASDSRTVLYSTTPRTNVAIRFLGRIRITEATAGTWATGHTNITGPTSDRSGIVSADASGVLLTSTTAKTIVSIVIPPGKWDVSGSFAFTPTNTTTLQSLLGGIGQTTDAIPSPSSFSVPDQATGEMKQRIPLFATTVTPGNTNQNGMAIATYRVNFPTQTTLYLTEQATFGASTLTGSGFIQARRIYT